MHVIAAKAVAFKEALEPGFKAYQEQTIANARKLAATLMDRGYDIVSGGTDNHLFLLDLIKKEKTGKDVEAALGKANITVNKNAVPNDPQSPFITSGIRVGTPAVTTRGFKEPEIEQLGGWMADVMDNIDDEATRDRVKNEVLEVCGRHPVYP
jgi:glycine hydroxymethyltransferase